MNFFLVTLFSLFLAIQASPLSFAPRAQLDVYDPTITSPNKSTTWCIGGTETVTWKTDDAPALISNRASISLRGPFASTNDSPTSLWVQLAKDFDLRSGSQEVVIPSNTKAGQYEIVLFGDSGNNSDLYLIMPCGPDGHIKPILK